MRGLLVSLGVGIMSVMFTIGLSLNFSHGAQPLTDNELDAITAAGSFSIDIIPPSAPAPLAAPAPPIALWEEDHDNAEFRNCSLNADPPFAMQCVTEGVHYLLESAGGRCVSMSMFACVAVPTRPTIHGCALPGSGWRTTRC